MIRFLIRIGILLTLTTALVGCGDSKTASTDSGDKSASTKKKKTSNQITSRGDLQTGDSESSVWKLLGAPDANTNIRVNKYLWISALETLNFLPVNSADPFTGVLVMGWGRAPGSNRDYRAVILIQDPALDARSLKVSLQTRNGTANAETTRQIEEAILTRARQLRVRDKNL